MLFIHHDQSQARDRSKHRRARAYHNSCLAGTYAMPLLRALIGRKRRVQNGDLISEELVQIRRRRRR